MKLRWPILLSACLLAGCSSGPREGSCAFQYTADIKQAVRAELQARFGDRANRYNVDNAVPTNVGRRVQLMLFPTRRPGDPDNLRVFVIDVEPCTRRLMDPLNSRP